MFNMLVRSCRYNFVAEQATPIRSWDKTAFMALGHRDPTAPGVRDALASQKRDIK